MQKTQKQITLKEYVKIAGSQEEAAHLIGVAHSTLNRWLLGKSKPHGLSRDRLRDLGISVDNLGKV